GRFEVSSRFVSKYAASFSASIGSLVPLVTRSTTVLTMSSRASLNPKMGALCIALGVENLRLEQKRNFSISAEAVLVLAHRAEDVGRRPAAVALLHVFYVHAHKGIRRELFADRRPDSGLAALAHRLRALELFNRALVAGLGVDCEAKVVD